MSNYLTGDFDAVVEVRLGTINRILAALHQNGASKDVSPSFPHSFAMRVGDVLTFTKLPAVAFQVSAAPSGGGSKKVDWASASSQSLPGVAKVMQRTLDELKKRLVPRPATLRGTARVQVSAPTITFPPGSTSEVFAELDARVHYVADPGTLVAPEPIHGLVRAAFSIGTAPFRTAGGRIDPAELERHARRLPSDGGARGLGSSIRAVLRHHGGRDGHV